MHKSLKPFCDMVDLICKFNSLTKKTNNIFYTKTVITNNGYIQNIVNIIYIKDFFFWQEFGLEVKGCSPLPV